MFLCSGQKYIRVTSDNKLVRSHIHGTAERPRLNVIIDSYDNICAQLIDDEKDVTLTAAGSFDKWFEYFPPASIIEGAKIIGAVIAKRALYNGITEVVLDVDKATFNHGAFNAFAEAASEAGLKFLSQRGFAYCWTKKFQTTDS